MYKRQNSNTYHIMYFTSQKLKSMRRTKTYNERLNCIIMYRPAGIAD